MTIKLDTNIELDCKLSISSTKIIKVYDLAVMSKRHHCQFSMADPICHNFKGAVKLKFFIASKWSTILQNHTLSGLFLIFNVFLQDMGVLLLPEVENFNPETTYTCVMYDESLQSEIIGQQYCILKFPLLKTF